MTAMTPDQLTAGEYGHVVPCPAPRTDRREDLDRKGSILRPNHAYEPFWLFWLEAGESVVREGPPVFETV